MSFEELVHAHGLTVEFPPPVMAEVEAYLRAPGLDDPELVDRTALPFVTIDGPGTRDLDQAIHVAATGAGFHLRYAIADASYYVQPGTALHAEALRRGASYYLPGLSVPMLPRPLSEGLVSLGPDGERRALIFDVELDGRGTVTAFRLERARVRSRAKLTFEQVDAFVTGRAAVPGPRAIGASLMAVATLGELRGKHEDRAAMVRYQRPETQVRLGADGGLVIDRAARTGVELANEQISILCNALGGRYLQGGPPELVQPIYRVHEPPEPERVAGFERLVAAVARQRGLPDDPWLYRRAADQGLAGYLQHLPTTGPGGRLARALHRQAMLLNGRSRFDAEPRAHFGVGEQIYSRFTAPMREMVGIQCHAQAIDRLRGSSPRSRTEDEAIRAKVIEAGNRAKDLQRTLNREIDARAVASVLGPDLAAPPATRRRRGGTVMGLAPGRVYVAIDDPPLDVRVPLAEQGRHEDGAWLTAVDEGARLARKDGTTVCRLGDVVRVMAVSPDAVVIDAVVMPLTELHDELVDVTSAAVRAFLAERAELRAVGLALDEDTWAIRMVTSGNGWDVTRWNRQTAPELAAAAALVRGQAGAHDPAAFHATVLEALTTALEDVDTHGAFDTRPVPRFVVAGDGHDARALVRASAERLNHRGEAQAIVAALAAQ